MGYNSTLSSKSSDRDRRSVESTSNYRRKSMHYRDGLPSRSQGWVVSWKFAGFFFPTRKFWNRWTLEKGTRFFHRNCLLIFVWRSLQLRSVANVMSRTMCMSHFHCWLHVPVIYIFFPVLKQSFVSHGPDGMELANEVACSSQFRRFPLSLSSWHLSLNRASCLVAWTVWSSWVDLHVCLNFFGPYFVVFQSIFFCLHIFSLTELRVSWPGWNVQRIWWAERVRLGRTGWAGERGCFVR